MLLIIFLINFAFAENELIPNKKFQLNAQAFMTLNQWDEELINIKDNENSAPLIALDFSGEHFQKSFSWLYDIAYAKNSFDLETFGIQAGAQKEFWTNIKLGLKFFSYKTVLDNEEEDSLYDFSHSGYQIFGNYFYKDYIFGLNLITSRIDDSTIDTNEGDKTKLHHAATDFIMKLHVLKTLNDIKLYFEYATYSLAETNILSKSFSYTIEADHITKYILGGGYVYKNYEFWLKYNQITNPQDEVSYFYQNPRFYPDYMLDKEFLVLEFKWNF